MSFSSKNDLQKYFYQHIEGKQMGFNPYYFREDFEKIAKKKCQSTKTVSPESQNQDLENIAEELRDLISK